MGLFSCADGETLAADLLGVSFVHLWHNLLESSGVEALREDGRPTDDVLTCGKLLGVPVQHFLLDGIPEGFSFGLGFLNQFLQ